MAKVLIFMFFAVFFGSCTPSNHFDSSKHDMVFMFDQSFYIDLESGILKINFGEHHYQDTISLSHPEKKSILSSFEKNKIYLLEGESFYYDRLTLPGNDFVIKLIENGQIKNNISVDYRYKNTGETSSDVGLRVMNFKDDVLKTLTRNPRVKKARKLFFKWYSEDMYSPGKKVKGKN